MTAWWAEALPWCGLIAVIYLIWRWTERTDRKEAESREHWRTQVEQRVRERQQERYRRMEFDVDRGALFDVDGDGKVTRRFDHEQADAMDDAA